MVLFVGYRKAFNVVVLIEVRVRPPEMIELLLSHDDVLATLVSVFVWGLTLTFGGVTLLWVVEVCILGRNWESPTPEYGGDEIQVRVLTIDAEHVVQETVDSLPASLTDTHVIAEEPIDITGATVHVVPDTFDCAAVRKGRALEWARQHIACEKEFVLYLDEDSLVTEFNGLPDADVVQIRERPRQTGSFLTYLADIYRVGVQLEQRAFGQLAVPLFAWGGGIAVRKTLEDQVTWNRETLVEDTAFVWRAALWEDADYALADATFSNQAPPSFREILEQRRRWAAGNHQEAAVLPRRYRWVTRLRNAVWGISPFAPLAALPATLLGLPIAFAAVLTPLTLLLAGFMVVWFVLGLQFYGAPRRETVGIILVPIASVVHSLGTIFGLVFPPDDFRVTKKIPAEDTERDVSPTSFDSAD